MRGTIVGLQVMEVEDSKKEHKALLTKILAAFVGVKLLELVINQHLCIQVQYRHA